MNSLLLTGGRVVDPANQFDSIADVLIIDGKISAIGKKLSAPAGERAASSASFSQANSTSPA